MAEIARPLDNSSGSAAAPHEGPALTPIKAGSGNRFLEKTLRELTHGLESTLVAEETARLPGLLQRLDPRGKVVWFLALLLTVGFVRHIPTLLALCLLVHLLAVGSRLSLASFARRVWVFVPFFAVVVALPAIFNFITPGRLLVEVADLGQPFAWGLFALPQHVGISEQGLRGAVTLVLRVATSVSLAVTLVMTTPWTTLLASLEALHLPRTLVLILGMTYRYIVLFLRTADAMFLARRSRTVGHLSGAEQRRWLAGVGGSLLGKSYHLSNEVYLAML
ncbi:MAG: cobalt ECF transporter T component CbiQ, partial [Chloroflexota bacterium]